MVSRSYKLSLYGVLQVLPRGDLKKSCLIFGHRKFGLKVVVLSIKEYIFKILYALNFSCQEIEGMKGK